MNNQNSDLLETSSFEAVPVQEAQERYQPRHAGGHNRSYIAPAVTSFLGVASLLLAVGVGMNRGDVDAGGCPAASEKAKIAVAELFPLADSKSSPDMQVFTDIHTYSDEDYRAVQTFFDDSRLENPKLPVIEYVAMANMIDNQVGMEFSIPETTHDSSEYSAVSLEATAKDANASRSIRSAIAQHALDVVRLPKEYWEYLAISQVKLVDFRVPETRGDFYQEQPDTVFLDVIPAEKTTVHEGSHKLESEQCGGMSAIEKDAAYTNLNPDDIYIGRSAYLAYEACKRRSQEQELDVSATCEANYDDVAEGVVADIYGLVAPYEDKAMVLEKLTSANGFVYVFGQNNVLRAKGVELLGRMYDDEPTLVEYFASLYEMQRQLFTYKSDAVSVK